MMGFLALAVIASVVGLLLRWAGSPEPHGSASSAGAKEGMSGSRNVVVHPGTRRRAKKPSLLEL